VTDLKTKWARADGPVKVGVGMAAAIVGLVVVVKILPALIAALGIGAFLAILFVPYWIPTIVAFVRKHPSRFGVFAVNFFFGWTFVGWVVSLAWALSDNTGRVGQQTVVVNTTVANTMHAPPPMHRIGDVVNGHLFDGASWVPVGPGSAVGETVSGR
jgi:T4 superinfection immunity protein